MTSRHLRIDCCGGLFSAAIGYAFASFVGSFDALTLRFFGMLIWACGALRQALLFEIFSVGEVFLEAQRSIALDTLSHGVVIHRNPSLSR